MDEALLRVLGWRARLSARLARLIPVVLYRTQPGLLWRLCVQVHELSEVTPSAMQLFEHSFGHGPPAEPRHFVVVYFPPRGAPDRASRVVAYGHQRPYKDVYLGGGMCVDERIYRRFPKWLFARVKRAGGLASILSFGSMSRLGDSPASFGHVGEPRARQADLRAGYVDTGVPHLMVFWLKRLTQEEKAALIQKVERHGPF